jgi:hypothetical protein
MAGEAHEREEDLEQREATLAAREAAVAAREAVSAKRVQSSQEILDTADERDVTPAIPSRTSVRTPLISPSSWPQKARMGTATTGPNAATPAWIASTPRATARLRVMIDCSDGGRCRRGHRWKLSFRGTSGAHSRVHRRQSAIATKGFGRARLGGRCRGSALLTGSRNASLIGGSMSHMCYESLARGQAATVHGSGGCKPPLVLD